MSFTTGFIRDHVISGQLWLKSNRTYSIWPSNSWPFTPLMQNLRVELSCSQRNNVAWKHLMQTSLSNSPSFHCLPIALHWPNELCILRLCSSLTQRRISSEPFTTQVFLLWSLFYHHIWTCPSELKRFESRMLLQILGVFKRKRLQVYCSYIVPLNEAHAFQLIETIEAIYTPFSICASSFVDCWQWTSLSYSNLSNQSLRASPFPPLKWLLN